MQKTSIIQRNTAKARQRSDLRDVRVYVSLEYLTGLRHRARGYSFSPGRPVSSLLSGRYGSRLRGRGLNFEEIRQYQHDDDIRTMDWKVTARTGQPHVRVYTEERDRAVILVVDQRTHMFFGSSVRMKSVVAAETAALAAWKALEDGDRVGALVFNDEKIETVKPQRSTATVMQILRVIEKMNNALHAQSTTQENTEQLNNTLYQLQKIKIKNGLILCITDTQGTGQRTQRIITQLSQQNDLLFFSLYDPLRSSPQRLEENIIVTDAKSHLELEVSDYTFMEKIAKDYIQDKEVKQSQLRKVSAALIPVNTVEDVTLQIRRLLGNMKA